MKNLLNCAVKAMKNNKFSLPSGKGLGVRLLTTLLLLTLGVGQMWAGKGFWRSGQWNVKYYDGSGSDKWIGEGDDGATKDLGIKTTLYLKGSWVKTWSDGGWTQSSVVWNYGLSSSYGNTKTATKSSVQGNQTWDFSVDYNVIANAPNNPGQNTIYMYWRLDDYVSSTASYINFTIPGFKKTSVSQDFGNVTVSSTKDLTISFTQHYGTALTTSNCALSGTNSSEFEVRSISETGVTVRFKPSSNGSKSATLTITDAHSKTCTITLSGKTQRAVTYKKGDNGTGSDITDYKVYNTNLTLRSSGFTRTGYNLTAWNTSSNGTSGTSYALGATYSSNNALTLYPTWTEKTYSLTFSHDGHGSIAVGGATVASGSTASVNHVNTKTLVATPNTGYRFTGWTKSGSNTSAVTIGDASAASTTIKATNTGATITAGFAVKTYTITLDGNGGSDGSATATYNSSTLTSVTGCSRPSYDLNGYYTATSGGTKVINANGTLVANVSGYTNSSSQWIMDDNVELHAQWTYNPVTYSVTYAVGTGYTSYGSLSAKNSSTSAAISSGSSVESGTGITFTATPNTGYVVEGWYTNAACTTGKHDAGSTTYTIASLSSDVTVYVKFVEKTWSVAFAAGTGGTVTTPNSTPRTVGQLTGISIAATPSTGYTFNTWTITSGSGSFTSSATTNSNKFKPTAASTITASFNETKSTITVTTANSSQGTLKFGSTSKSWGATASLGVATTQSITATAAAGFRFVRWDLSGAAASSSTLTNTTITLKADGSGSTGTATAVFEEDLSSPWIVAGGNKIVTTGTTWRTTADANNTMLKKTGHSTESVVYFTVPVTTVCSGGPNTNFQFKIYNTSTSKWYGLFASGSYYLLKAEDGTEKSLVEDNQNIELRAYVTGDYEFKLDYSTSTPKLTVTWPVINQVRISAASPTDATNTGNFDLSDPVSNVRTVTRSLKANTTYTFKIMYNSDWYGYNSGTFTRSNSTSSNSRTISTSGGDMTLTTDYAGDYTFKFNQSTKALSVDFPAAYKITFGQGSVNGKNGSFSAVNLSNGNSAVTSNSTWVKSGHNVKITAPNAKSGYRFLGWYDNNSATGDAITTLANCTITVNTTKTVYACYAENLTAITITTDGHGTITTPSPNSSPYSLGVTTGEAINASANPGYTWSTWTTSGTAVVSTPSTKSNTAKGDGTNGGTGTITATFTPNPYTITLNKHNGQSNGSISVTFDANTNLTGTPAITVPEKTGYTFGGYYTSENGEGVQVIAANGNVVASASGGGNTYTDASKNWKYPNNITLHAKWTAKQSALTFDYQTSATGYGSAGTATASASATYGSAMPALTGTLPTAANGYAFMGFYDATGGGGTKYYNADGSSAHNWNKNTESGTTLYAYYKKAEIAAITFDNAVVESKGTVSFAVTVSPTPVGDTKLCFTVLHSNDNPLAEQPTVTYSAGKYSFKAPEASGTYKVEAVLRTGSSCDGGTELDTEVANFQVAGIHTVTVQFKCGDEIIKASETVTGRPLDPTEITAPEIVGYAFSKWKAGDGITIEGADGNGEKASATINFTAIYDGKLTAIYTQKRMIYFYNTLNWENVYVYFYKDGNYWDNSKGTGTDPSYYSGSHNSDHKGKMLPVAEGSKIYYFDAEGASIPAGYTNVAFTEKQQDNCWYFYDNNKVARRSDYKSTMPLFVPLSDQPEVKKNSNAASYYCEGYWMNYPANSGYTLRIYDTPGANNATGASREFLIPFSEDVKMPLKQEVEVNFSGESWFIIYRNDGKYLEGSHTFKQTDHGDKKITSTDNAGTASKMRLISDGSGIYTFTLTFRGDGGENYDYYLNVDFPAAVGDYRIVYSDNATWSNGAHSSGWYHPSDIIGKNTSETDAKEDTVSFFISHGSSPSMKFQRISAISESAGSYGKITWEDVPSGSITIPTSITASGVYNFIVTQPAGGASISLVKAEPYTGNYYIRTDCAGETKWNNFRSPDHLITYSEYSITHGGYSHYYAHWVQTDDKKNIQFCIANDYSSAISDTLIRENNSDPAWTNINNYIDVNGNILRNANVRFMWNQSTNKVSRAYVDGAQDEGSRFLVISSTDGMIKKADGSALSNNEVTFSDNENWIYEANVKAQPNALIKLKSTWGTSNTIEQYFKGSSTTTEKLIGGSGSLWYDIRILYDFKTNRLIASYIPVDENITTEKAIEADIMFIREHQGDIAQLTFGESGKISKIETAYGVMRFNKWTLANKSKEEGHAVLGDPKSIYERSLYWISFPFRVKLSEVIGFGTYGTHWAVQRYDGAGRAANGYWAESSSYWRWMNRNTEYLEPDQGYLLAIDVDLLGESSDVWGPMSRSEQIEIYFPSYGTMPDITKATVTCTIPSHACTINWAETKNLPDTGDPRTSYNRTVFDSHWNVISVPTYVNTNDVTFANTTWTGQIGPNFLYTWNADDHTITATSASGYTYHAMHAYMVQYGGNITWDANHVSSIVARRTYAEAPSRVEFRLELQQNEQMIDRTYVALSSDEETSAGFRFGEDMTKEFNANKSSIYTFIANEATVAGNTLPMTEQTTVVPMGVEIKTAGDYTFAIPDGTEGIGVTLIDTETGIRTSLSALDYTVNLTAGKHDSRFVLEISPIQQMPTDIDQLPIINDQSSVKKVLIDGLLYIVKDGQLFDATGKVVTR